VLLDEVGRVPTKQAKRMHSMCQHIKLTLQLADSGYFASFVHNLC